jgi:hypothetical protein
MTATVTGATVGLLLWRAASAWLVVVLVVVIGSLVDVVVIGVVIVGTFSIILDTIYRCNVLLLENSG